MDKNGALRGAAGGPVALAVVVLAALWLWGLPLFLAEVRLLTASAPGSGHYRLATCGNTLLAASAALYVGNLLLSLELVGRWASRFAAAGALLLAVDAGSHLLGLGRLRVGQELSFLDLYDAFAMVVPMVVASYLLVEHAGHNRGSGAFVMPLVLCLVGVEMWLLAQGAGSRDALLEGFREYWGHAYLVAHVLGYGAFAAAAAVGLLHLLRSHLASRGRRLPPALRRLPDGWRAQNWMLSAVAAGVVVFALALFFAAGWGFTAGAPGPYAAARMAWVVSVLAFYGIFLGALYSRAMSARRMAWWTIAGLAVSLALFRGVHLLGTAPIAA